MAGNSEMGLYVHVPFCRRKCRYCDFYSRPPRPSEPDRFVSAVQREAALRCGDGGRLSTVYVGGGTPSLLGPERLARILDAARTRFHLNADAEITVEGNPRDVTGPWAEGCLAAGCNRLSIGVQSMDETDLAFLGRQHHAADGPAAVRAARAAGFKNIGIDLIYGLPGQTPDVLRSRLAGAVEACRPDHVSCYQLTYAPETPLGRDRDARRITPLSAEAEEELFLLAHECMAELGYEGYEVSNFVRDRARRSRHNGNYWRHVDYVGLGPAAHSFESPVRSWNVRSVSDYLTSIEQGRPAVEGQERLSSDQLGMERVMLGLRTTDGVDLRAYRELCGRDLLVEKRSVVDSMVAHGHVRLEGDRLRPTLSGLAVADSLAADLG